jgi:class 3 adenylate cyclase
VIATASVAARRALYYGIGAAPNEGDKIAAAVASHALGHWASLWDSQRAALFMSGGANASSASAASEKHASDAVDGAFFGGLSLTQHQLSWDSQHVQFTTALDGVSTLDPAGFGAGKTAADGATLTVEQITAARIAAQLLLALRRDFDSVLHVLGISDMALVTACDRARDQYVAIAGGVVAAALVVAWLVYALLISSFNDDMRRGELGLKILYAGLPDDARAEVPELAVLFAGDAVDAEGALKKSLQLSEKLLQNILPPVISRRLKSGENPIADDHPRVTAVFAAVVGFDAYRRRLAPRGQLLLLNALVVACDDIVDQLLLEKIKTIGDTYFFCGGLTQKTERDHALRCVECAMAFHEVLGEFSRRQHLTGLRYKIGIHTGPAVAGVIGSVTGYDLWGDTVNMASRMCTTGEVGSTQLSAETHGEVRAYFRCSPRAVYVKGKGNLTTFLVRDRSEEEASPFAGSVNVRKTLRSL